MANKTGDEMNSADAASQRKRRHINVNAALKASMQIAQGGSESSVLSRCCKTSRTRMNTCSSDLGPPSNSQLSFYSLFKPESSPAPACAMSDTDFFRAWLGATIDLRHPLAVPATRMPWDQIEASVAPFIKRKPRVGRVSPVTDLFGTSVQVVGAGTSPAGRPRLPIRLIGSLLYLKHA